MSSAGLECVCVFAQVCTCAKPPRLPAVADDLQNLRSIAGREKRGGMRERKREERTSVIYGRDF